MSELANLYMYIDARVEEAVTELGFVYEDYRTLLKSIDP